MPSNDMIASIIMYPIAALTRRISGKTTRPRPYESGPGNEERSESSVNLLQSLIDNLHSVLRPGVLDDVWAAPRVPPASKQVVANLPVITITDQGLKKLGEDADCCICKETLVVKDK